MSKRLAGKVAIVTGAGGGIGRHTALLLASQGASVVVNDLGTRTGANAASVVEEITKAGGTAVANTDSATWKTAPKIVETALDAFKRVDILINNATAGGPPADIWNFTEENWDFAHEVNVKGYFAMIRACAPHFCEQGSGAIVSMSSGAGFGHPAMIAYACAKEGVTALTRTAAAELGRFGVRANCVRPMALAASSDEYMVVMAKWLKLLSVATPGGTSGSMKAATPETHPPAKIAPAMVWLCTDAASNVNGRTFHIRGDHYALLTEPSVHERGMLMEGGWTLDALDARAPKELTVGLNNSFLLNDHPDLKVFER
jgi:NAD(P)-dependent dehydrogenase (short-subunit alcohol dehydrogenase family)